MSRGERDKWDDRYRGGAYATRTHPSALLAEWLPKLEIDRTPPRAADIACGAGRNALYLGELGWQVDAIDISQVALERLAAAAAATAAATVTVTTAGTAAAAAMQRGPITCLRADLDEPSSLPSILCVPRRYDLILIVRYTNLPLIESLQPAIETGGYLIVEEHLETTADVIGPRSPQFRVAPGALREAAAGLDVIEYREGIVEDPDGRRAALAQLIARKPSEAAMAVPPR